MSGEGLLASWSAYSWHRDFCPWHEDQRDSDCTCEPACGVRKPGWYCSREPGHDGPCAAWPVSHEAADIFYPCPAIARERQSKVDSLMESLVNIAIGLAVSQVANLIVLPAVFGVPVSQGQALALGVIYTAISLLRSYTIRRAFNGRSVWQAIKGAFA